MKIAGVALAHPVALAPMAGMTDTAFRRLVKRKGGCGLVVTEMVSSEGLGGDPAGGGDGGTATVVLRSSRMRRSSASSASAAERASSSLRPIARISA